MTAAQLEALEAQAARPDGVYAEVLPSDLRQLLEERVALIKAANVGLTNLNLFGQQLGRCPDRPCAAYYDEPHNPGCSVSLLRAALAKAAK